MTLREQKYVSFGLTAQPLPVIVGEFHNIQNCFVCIDSIRYNIDTPLKAIDLCFKVYHTLNAQYPKEAEPIWTFLQLYIYEIKTLNDGNFTSVSSLMSEIDLMLDEKENK